MDSNERVNLTVGELKQLPFDIADAGPGNINHSVCEHLHVFFFFLTSFFKGTQLFFDFLLASIGDTGDLHLRERICSKRSNVFS